MGICQAILHRRIQVPPINDNSFVAVLHIQSTLDSVDFVPHFLD